MNVGHSKWSVRNVFRFWVSMRQVSPGKFCSMVLMVLQFLKFYAFLAFTVQILRLFLPFLGLEKKIQTTLTFACICLFIYTFIKF